MKSRCWRTRPRSLINQARNLASLPYSSLAQLQQQITQTQQLLAQAQRIAYSVTTIDQAFTQTYPQAYSALDFVAAASRRRADALAERARELPGHHARAGRRGHEPQQYPHADQCSRIIEPVGHRRTSGRPVRQPARRPPNHATRGPDGAHGRRSPERKASMRARTLETQAQAQAQTSNFLNYGTGYQPGSAQMFH